MQEERGRREQLTELRQKNEEIGDKEKQFNHRKEQAELQQRQVP